MIPDKDIVTKKYLEKRLKVLEKRLEDRLAKKLTKVLEDKMDDKFNHYVGLLKEYMDDKFAMFFEAFAKIPERTHTLESRVDDLESRQRITETTLLLK